MKKNVITLDASDASSLSSFDASKSITFQEPKKISRDSCICLANVTSSGSRTAGTKSFVLNIPRTRLVRTLKSKDSVTLIVNVANVAKSHVHKFLLSLDQWSLTSAMEHSDKWFMHNMNASLVEDFFKGSVEMDCRTGSVVARFKLYIADDDALVPTMTVGRDYSLSLKFVGLQFRKQNFAAVWKLQVANDVTTEAKNEFIIVDTDDDVSEKNDDDDDEIIGPMPQEMLDMVAEMQCKIAEKHARYTSIATTLSDLSQRLSQPSLLTIGNVNEVADALADIE